MVALHPLTISTYLFFHCFDYSDTDCWDIHRQDYGEILGEDPRTVVIDEFFGTWIACIAALYCDSSTYNTVIYAAIAFILFRIIDITKPLGCRWLDKNIHGGWGCMLDDALAGLYAILITLILRYFDFAQIIHNNIQPLLPDWLYF